MENTRKPYQILAWSASSILVLGSLLAAFNIHPAYIYVFLVANCMWTVVSFLWREPSLFLLNFGVLTIYIVGLIFG